MALKDWRVESKGKQFVVYVNSKTDKRIDIGKYYANSPYPNGSWRVYSSPKVSEWFKTKSQALSFAKKYMRSH